MASDTASAAMSEKKQLRAVYLRQRHDLSAERRREINSGITERVLSLPAFAAAETLFVYISTEDEIATGDIIRTALEQGKCVCVPKCLPGRRMQARRITSTDDLTEQTFGIPEPHAGCPVIEPEDIDLCLVPSLACDRRGYRLGYGGGFYDRYLPNVTGETAVLCASERIADSLPTDEYDIRCRVIITENEVYTP